MDRSVHLSGPILQRTAPSPASRLSPSAFSQAAPTRRSQVWFPAHAESRLDIRSDPAVQRREGKPLHRVTTCARVSVLRRAFGSWSKAGFAVVQVCLFLKWKVTCLRSHRCGPLCHVVGFNSKTRPKREHIFAAHPVFNLRASIFDLSALLSSFALPCCCCFQQSAL